MINKRRNLKSDSSVFREVASTMLQIEGPGRGKSAFSHSRRDKQGNRTPWRKRRPRDGPRHRVERGQCRRITGQSWPGVTKLANGSSRGVSLIVPIAALSLRRARRAVDGGFEELRQLLRLIKAGRVCWCRYARGEVFCGLTEGGWDFWK